MVVQRTINNLRERPHHERRAVALIISLGVIVVLFFGWSYQFFVGVRASSEANLEAEQAAQAQTASVGAIGGQPVQ